jgi:hypothetical protein
MLVSEVVQAKGNRNAANERGVVLADQNHAEKPRDTDRRRQCRSRLPRFIGSDR